MFLVLLTLSMTVNTNSAIDVKAKTTTIDTDSTFTLGKANIDYPAFVQLSNEVQQYRQQRLVGLEDFLKMSEDPGTIILDTRSKAAYDGKHLKGAVHLNFSDFTEDKLAKVIPSKDTRVLIYCNNNILNDPISFVGKSMPLALNIPTFINLYGYGYKNIYEMANLVPVEHPDLVFEGASVK